MKSGSRTRARLINRSRWRVVRKVVLERDGYRCRSCGCAGKLEVDHVVALADGGDTWASDNLQTLCRRCHIKKTANENRQRIPKAPEVIAWDNLVYAMTKKPE